MPVSLTRGAVSDSKVKPRPMNGPTGVNGIPKKRPCSWNAQAPTRCPQFRWQRVAGRSCPRPRQPRTESPPRGPESATGAQRITQTASRPAASQAATQAMGTTQPAVLLTSRRSPCRATRDGPTRKITKAATRQNLPFFDDLGTNY